MQYHCIYLHILLRFLTSCTAILPAVLFLFLPVMEVVLSTCDSCSLFSLSDIESVVSEVFSIQRFRNSAVPHLTVILTSCNAVLPAVLFLFLPVVLVVVISTCDSFSLSSLSDI